MRMDADDSVESGSHRGYDLGQVLGQRPAVGIAETKDIGAGSLSGFESLHRVVAVVNVTVEEVFGIVDHFFAVLLQVGYGFGDELEVFFESNA